MSKAILRFPDGARDSSAPGRLFIIRTDEGDDQLYQVIANDDVLRASGWASPVYRLPGQAGFHGNPYLMYGDGIRHWLGQEPTGFSLTCADVTSGQLLPY